MSVTDADPLLDNVLSVTGYYRRRTQIRVPSGLLILALPEREVRVTGSTIALGMTITSETTRNTTANIRQRRGHGILHPPPPETMYPPPLCRDEL